MIAHTLRPVCAHTHASLFAFAVTLSLAPAGFGQTVEERTFRASVDDSEQKYVVVMPEDFAADKPHGLLIALHGHGTDRWQFVRQERDECRAVRDVAAKHGLLLVSPDYRAKTSWMGPKAEADTLDLLRILKQRFKIDRVILCGGSMGGTAALTFAALHPEQVDGVVSLNGTANLVEYERFSEAIAESFGGTKEQKPEEYRRRSAEFFADRFTMPLAATTGGRDEVVPAASVLRLLETVRSHNSRTLSLHRPEGGHSTNYDDTREALEFVLKHAMAAR
ncbi:MAG: alpha/beta fold hydrolase [Pirellulaceae bacterium]